MAYILVTFRCKYLSDHQVALFVELRKIYRWTFRQYNTVNCIFCIVFVFALYLCWYCACGVFVFVIYLCLCLYCICGAAQDLSVDL